MSFLAVYRLDYAVIAACSSARGYQQAISS